MKIESAGYGAVAILALVLAYDPSQSTGSGTTQGAGGETGTSDRAPVDSKSGKNEDSGSATGAVRDKSKTGMESGASHGSTRNQDAGRTMDQSGGGTTSGAARSRK